MKNRIQNADKIFLSATVIGNQFERVAMVLSRVRAAIAVALGLLILSDASAQTIRLISAPGNFYGDDKAGNGILNNYAAYVISNNTAVTLPSVYVAITNINSTNLIQLAANDPGERFLGSLAPGQEKIAAFYLRGPSLTGSSFAGLTNEVHTIRVLDAPVGFGGAVLATANFSYTNINYVLEASANKVTIITNLNPKAVLGSLVPLVIGGQSGTIGSPPSLEFSPAVFDNWRADAYQLERTLVVFDQNPSYSNRLYFDVNTPGFTNYANNNYTNTYYFRACKVTGTNVPVSPFGFIASGTQIKHTALSSLSALGPTNSAIVSVTNGTVMGQTVSPTFLTAGGGTVTYSIIISNISGVDVQLDRVVDVLPGAPAAVSFVNNSATFNSVTLTNPGISGQTLTWNLPFAIPANSTGVLAFQAVVPATPGQYTNSVTGVMGLEQIDTTLDTSDNSPALAILGVGSADVAIGKSAAGSVLAGADLTYTINVTNLGPTTASGVVVTDALPVGVTFVSASGGGVNSGGVVTWNLGTLANNQTSNLTVTVTVPASGSLTNTANVSTTTTDSNSANNVSPPVVTAIIPQADLAIAKAGPANVAAANALTYTISVTNLGPSDAGSVIVTDALPAGVTFVNASGNGVNNAGLVTWNLGTLISGQVSNLTVTVSAPAGGTLTNTASIGSPTADPNATNNVTPPVTTVVTPVADLAIGKAGPASVTFGGNFNYTIAVTNFGPSAATGILVTDSLPANLLFVGATAGATTNTANEVIWNLAALAAGASTNLTLTVNPASTGISSNTAKLGSPVADPNPTNNFTPPVVTTINPAPPTVTWTNPASVVYGTVLGTNQNNASATVGGTYTYNPTNGIVLPAGTNTLNVQFTPSDTNYAATNLSVQLIITPAPLTITANDQSKTYGAALTLGTTAFTSSGLVNGETIGSVTLTSAGSVTNAGAGTYPIVPSAATGGTFSAANYSINYSNGVLTVGQATLNIAANDTNKIYGATNPSFTYTASGFVNGETVSVLSGSPSLTTVATTNSGVGTYPIVATNGTLSAANYTFSFVNGTLTVGKAALTVTANDTNKIYGAVNPTFTASYTGFVNGETAGVLSGSPGLTSSATTNSGVGTYPITATNGTLAAANYVFSFVSGTLTVNAATLTVSANSTNRLYNTPNPVFAANYSGFVNGENSSVLSGAPSLTTPAVLSSPVGTYPINATNGTLSAANYVFSFANGTLTVLGGSYAITWTNPASIVYGTLLDTNQNDAAATIGGTFTYNPTNGTMLLAGTNTLAVVFTPSDTNYAATNVNVQLMVTPAPLTIMANNTNKAYHTTLNLGTTAFASIGLVSGETIGSVTMTSAGTVASAPVGTYPITPSNATGGTFNPANYSLTYSNGTLTVMASSYIATWPVPTNIVYGTVLDTNQNNATATIDGTFTYNPTNGTVLSAGTNLLTVLFTPADTNYAATNLSVPLVVLPAPLTITADDTNKVYGNTLTLGAGQTAFASSGLVNGDSVVSVTLTSAGAAGAAPVGTYPLVPSAAVGDGLTNYSIAYSNGSLTVLTGVYGIGWTNPANVVYGTPLGTNENHAVATIPGGYVYNPTNGTVLNAGTNLLNVLFTPSDTNYVATNVSVMLIVTPAPLSVTASNTARLYGQPNPVLGGTLSGIQNGDNLSASYTSVATTNSPVGAYPIVPTLSDPNSRLANYTVTTNNGTLTVNAATLTVTANDTNKIYGAANPTFTASYAGFANGETASVLSGSPGLTTVATTNSSAGTYPIVATNGTLGASNYVFSFASGTLTVGKAALTVAANDTNRLYGAASPTFTASYSGFVNGDTPSVLTGSPSLTTSATTNSGVGTYPIVATNGTLSAANYSFSFVDGTLTIGQASLSITASNLTKNYGAMLTLGAGQTAFSSTGLQNGETIGSVTLAASGGTATNAAPGIYTLTPSAATGGTFNPANYLVTYNDGALTVVTPDVADLAVTKTGPASGVAGSNLVYTITVTNLGPDTATNVFVKDLLPDGLNFIGATPSASLAGNAVNWAPFNLAANAWTNFTVTARSLEGGMFTNLASATSDAYDPNNGNNDGSATESQARTTVSALADVAVFKDGSTNAYAGDVSSYTITVTNLGPSTAANVVVQDRMPTNTTFVSASGSYTVSNNIVAWDALTLSNGQAMSFTIALKAPLTGSITNIAFSTSSTADPNPTNNNGTLGQSRVASKVLPSADVMVLLAGPPSAVQGSNFVYTITVTNAGPSVSSNVVVSDSLPPGLLFVSATGNGKNTNGTVTWPNIKSLAVGAKTNFTLTVNASVPGLFTNAASALALTHDPNPTNNSGVTPASQSVTEVGVAQFSFLAGGPVFNPQTGLFEETVAVTNNASVTILGFRLYVGGLTNGVTLYNASGTSNGVPFVNYNFPVNPTNAATLILQFYDPTRLPFTHTLFAEAILPTGASNISTNGSVAVSRVFMDNRIEGDPRFVIEFASVPGKTYTIIYSSDLLTWKVATPSITAANNVTQWYDDGPPVTESKPSSVSARYYRVIQY